MHVIYAILALGLSLSGCAFSQNTVAQVKDVVEKTTLDQPGTHPFHLKAELAPSFERDKASGRTGTVEIWWASPSEWRREMHSPTFDQVEIVNGSQDWQKNSSDYLPEWLREMAVALVKPVPNLDAVLAQVKKAQVRTILGATHISWVEMGTDGKVSKGIGQGVDLSNGGPLFAMTVGSDADLNDPSDFHGRRVARRVSGGGGGAEVTAHVTLLEDLPKVAPVFFDASAPGSDPLPLQTIVVPELIERQNGLVDSNDPWPPLAQGPLTGVMLLEVVIDRAGKVREIESFLSDNPGLQEKAEARVRAMQFHPYLMNGRAVQVVTTITMPFSTARPADAESFDSAKNIFDKARKTGYLAAGSNAPYVLKAEFTTKGNSGVVETGTYIDVWMSDTQWRRDAIFGKSRFIRSRNGDKRYLQAEGPDAQILKILFGVLEPIPATMDSWYEADWRMKRELVDGSKTLRVARGYESPDGVLDPKAEAYWFDEAGNLIKTHGNGFETRISLQKDYSGAHVARRVEILIDGKVVLRANVTVIQSGGGLDAPAFVLKGHEWVRQFTAEVR